MATEVIMPRQGNTVESCVILSWKKREGDRVAAGETLCEVETDKATFEIPSPRDGTLLKVLYGEGADVPVLKPIAVVGDPGEQVDSAIAGAAEAQASAIAAESRSEGNGSAPARAEPRPRVPGVSPRARRLAASRGLDPLVVAGSGPGGRVIERDVAAAIEARPLLTPAARAAALGGAMVSPEAGTGIGGRVRVADLVARPEGALDRGDADGTTEIPVKGVRKLIAERMRASLATTAQLTIDMAADARALTELRTRFKTVGAERGLSGITVNDMTMFAAARTLLAFKELNAHFLGDKIVQFTRVNVGFAVDTPRGLMVPVIRGADSLSLRELSAEAKRLAAACLSGAIAPDDFLGGTFTVSNLGALGVERFTPVLNAPQVAILGVGAIQPKAVQAGERVEFQPHLNLSLTVDHQAVDGAPAARFLRALCENLAQLDVLLAG